MLGKIHFIAFRDPRATPTASHPRDLQPEQCAFLDTPIATQLNQRYPETLKAIGQARLTEPQAKYLASRLAEHGDRAMAWNKNPSGDKYGRIRKADNDFLERQDDIRRAALLLSGHFSMHEQSAFAAIFNTLHEMSEKRNVRLITTTDGSTVSVAAELAAFLKLYADNIRKFPFARSGPFAHRFRFGPFNYLKPKDQGVSSADLFGTGLLFFAVTEAKSVTSGERLHSPFSKKGRPLWGIAVAYHQDLNPRRGVAAKTAQDRLKRMGIENPGVQWAGWPDPDPET